MNKTTRILIIAAVVAAAVLAFMARQSKPVPPVAPAESTVTTQAAANANAARATAKLPRLVDLGAGKCIPCKMMKPILDDLMANYADQFATEFIDVWENRDVGEQYGIEVIPTQIFYDAEGKELFRHIGFYSKEDILATWPELGVTLAGNSASESQPSTDRTTP